MWLLHFGPIIPALQPIRAAASSLSVWVQWSLSLVLSKCVIPSPPLTSRLVLRTHGDPSALHMEATCVKCDTSSGPLRLELCMYHMCVVGFLYLAEIELQVKVADHGLFLTTSMYTFSEKSHKNNRKIIQHDYSPHWFKWDNLLLIFFFF